MTNKPTTALDRTRLIEDIAESACDDIDLKDLIAFYYDNQVEWLSQFSDEDLVSYAYDYFHEFEEEEYVTES